MGEIFLAEANKSESEISTAGSSKPTQPVVLKRILPHLLSERQFIDRFVDEARLMTQLEHKNILPVYELRHDQWGLYMVMEYLESYDLRSINRHLGRHEERWPPRFAVWVIKELCEGLAYAHQKTDVDGQELGLIHRDVSPSNILLGSKGEVKIIDFGVARAQGLIHPSITGSLQGKLAYMSPEQARSEPIDQRSDIYSVGLTLYEMLAGVRPREGQSEAEILNLAQEARDLYLEDVWPEGDLALCELVNQSLKVDPFERFTHAEDLAQALGNWLRQAGNLDQIHTDLKVWLEQLAVVKTSEQQLSLDAAMELQLIVGNSGTPPSRSKGQETLSLSGSQVEILQNSSHIHSTPSSSSNHLAGSGLLVSSEQQKFSSVLNEIIKEPELLELLDQEETYKVKQTEQGIDHDSMISSFRYKLILWGSITFLLFLISIVYWVNTDQVTRFDLSFQAMVDGQLERVNLNSDGEITVDGRLWKANQKYALKKPLELCIRHPKWKSRCEWISLEDRAWYSEKAPHKKEPTVSIELKKKLLVNEQSNITLLSKAIVGQSKGPKSNQYSEFLQQFEPKQKAPATHKTVSKSTPKFIKAKSSSHRKARKAKKFNPSKVNTDFQVILKGINQNTALHIYCNEVKTKYQWLGSELIEIKDRMPNSPCIIKLKGYADLKFTLKGNAKRPALTAMPKGFLSLRVYPPAAQIYIDQKKVSNPLNEYELVGPSHTVRMTYQPEAQDVKLNGIEKVWEFKLEPTQRLRKFFDLSKE